MVTATIVIVTMVMVVMVMVPSVGNLGIWVATLRPVFVFSRPHGWAEDKAWKRGHEVLSHQWIK